MIDLQPPTIPDQLTNLIRSLPASETKRMGKSAVAHAYYGLRGGDLLRPNPAESATRFPDRDTILFPLVRNIVDAFTELLYPTHPTREFSDPLAKPVVEAVYAEEVIDELLECADRYAILDGAVAIHVYRDGDAIRITLYGGDEFLPVFGEDPLNPESCVTLANTDEGRRFTVWTPDAVGEYLLTGGELKEQKVERNIYGCLPFVFGHTTRPIRSFWEGAWGDFLSRGNAAIDGKSSDLSLAEESSLPVPFARNAQAGMQLYVDPAVFNPIPEGVELGYLEPPSGGLDRISGFKEWLYTFAGMCGVPREELEGIVSAGDSGIAILLRRIPLYEAARRRQARWTRTERELARQVWYTAIVTGLVTVPGITGSDQPQTRAVLAREYAQMLGVSVAWPEPMAAIRTPDRRMMDQADIDLGLTSRVKLVMRDFGFTRDQAVKHLMQVRQDEADLNTIGVTDGTGNNGDTPNATGGGGGRYDIATHLPGDGGAGSVDPSGAGEGVE